MNRYSPFLFVLLFIVHSAGFGAVRVLTWEESVQLVQTQNESLRASEANLKSSDLQFDAAYGSFLPQVSASVSYNQANTSTTSQDSYGASITASQSLFNGFQDKSKLEQARANRDLAKLALQSARAKASYDLKNAIASLLYAQNYLKLTDSIRQRRELNSKTVQLRFESGRENKGSLLLSKAYLEDAKLDALRAQQNLVIAEASLARTFGLEQDQQFQFNGSIPTADPAPDAALDFRALVVQTPAYLSAVAQESSAKGAVGVAQANFYPSLNVSAIHGS
ncbi:MAG: TolC family protein, partial [Proteobacteria bacterium]